MEETKKKLVVTHDGKFHADDVFAVAVISLLEDSQLRIVRTRDGSIMKEADYVIDVGATYDPGACRFDHHQEGGAGVRENGIPYAAFGLVWKKYGAELCGGLQTVADKIDANLIQPLDAGDNGLDIEQAKFEGLSSYGIDSAIDAFVSTWKEVDRDMDSAFYDLVQFAKALIAREIMQARAKEEAETFVEEAYANAEDKRIVVVDAPYPMRAVLAKHPEPLFFVRKQYNDTWTVNTVREDPNSFENKKSLPEAWAGKRDQELADITGVSDAVFCHIGRFIAVAKSKEGAVQLARLAVENQN